MFESIPATMNPEEFVKAIKMAVQNSTVNSVKTTLTKPAGRSPAKETIERSIWYNNLNEEDKRVVDSIICECARVAVFSFFCVLDGVRAIEDREDKGTLKLYYENVGEKILLNDQDNFILHEMV